MHKVEALLMVSLVLFGVWIAMIFNVRPSFLNIANSDSLAMVHALFPYYWLILSAYCVLCLSIFFLGVNNKLVHTLVLVQFSLVLYFTPFALSGLSWNPDNLWLSSVAKYVPDILSGKEVMFSTYTETFPSSFILTYSVTEVMGIDVFAFARFFPMFSIIALTLLGYVLASKFLGQRVAFISMLFVLPGWHYLDLHACPHMTGLLLLLTIMILLTRYERKPVAVIFLLMLSLVLSHPISPLTLSVFLVTVYFCIVMARRRFRRKIESINWIWSKKVLILFLGIVWIIWLLTAVFPISRSIEYAFRRVFTLSFGRSIVERVEEFSIGGGSFIYPEIFDLTRLTYASYVFVAGFLMLCDVTISKFMKKENTNNMFLRKVISFFSAFAFLAFSYLLLLGTGDHHLLYRGQIPFVLMVSIYIASYLFFDRKYNKIAKFFFSFWLLFLLLVFPVVSYSIGAYNSFPYSEGIGVKFIADNVHLSGKTVSMGTRHQISPYMDLSNVFYVIDFPPNLDKTHPEIIVLKKSSFYVIAMRYDISFEHNRFLELRDQLEEVVEYNKIYSNPTTETYVLNP